MGRNDRWGRAACARGLCFSAGRRAPRRGRQRAGALVQTEIASFQNGPPHNSKGANAFGMGPVPLTTVLGGHPEPNKDAEADGQYPIMLQKAEG